MTDDGTRAEVAEYPEAEVVNEQEEQGRELAVTEADFMDGVIEIGAKIEAFAKAMDSVMNVIIKQSYEGDWVCHANKSDAENKKKANLGAAAAERIAKFLGIQERSWTHGVKEWSDDKTHYTWVYEADFGFRPRRGAEIRWVHAIGKAGTRDKFFGFAHGQWKRLDEIREDHIKTAAFRACRKEGVRTLFGLRAVPLTKLAALGYDINNIAYAGFEEKGKALAADAVKPGPDGLTWRTIQLVKVQKVVATTKNAKGEPSWVRWDIFDAEGVKFGMFGEGKRITKLFEDCEKKVPSEFGFRVTLGGDKGQFKNNEIMKVKGIEE